MRFEILLAPEAVWAKKAPPEPTPTPNPTAQALFEKSQQAFKEKRKPVFRGE